MHFYMIESGPVGSLDITMWNCTYLDRQRLQKKSSSLPNEISISFCTWDFSGDVGSSVQICIIVE